MHFEQLDLNLLVALDALLTERSITAAGVRVHLTQSAMSGALSRLREFFNDDLLTQVGRKMVPTPLGESLAEPVRQILLQVRATINTKPGFDPATSTRHFSVMMSDYVDTVLMSDLLRRAEAVAPHVRFNLVSNDVAPPTEFIERADVDLLIMPREYLSDKHPARGSLHRRVCLRRVEREPARGGFADAGAVPQPRTRGAAVRPRPHPACRMSGSSRSSGSRDESKCWP